MSGQILTKAALLGRKAGDFKIVVHESKKKKNLKTKNLGKHGDEHEMLGKGGKDNSTVDLQKARKEVINLGLSGFSDKLHKEEAEIQLAIKLGARPPKRKYKNYKEILEEKKQVKKVDETTSEKIAKKFQFGSTQSFQKYVAGNRHKTKKNPKNVLNSYGKVNPVKDGIRKRK
uniref:CSON004702 protein n=1 Tax=Culicoides sonorensis TaxID=179676 RepID=A0A336K9D0_CULSO